MIKRFLCAFVALLLLVPGFSSAEGAAPDSFSYQFDLTFSMNPQSFPVLLRSKFTGYAELVNRLGIRGEIAWSTKTHSMDLNATVYFTDRESLSYPFRLYGTSSRLFFTSPMLKDEVIFLNMTALMEFAVKAKKTLNIPLPYIAFLFPHSTEYAFSPLADSWEGIIGTFRESGMVSPQQFLELSELWSSELNSNPDLLRWITALAEGSTAQDAVMSEFMELPYYYEYVTGSEPVTVRVEGGSQFWTNAAGTTFFSRQETDGSIQVSLLLPETVNRYTPTFLYTRTTDRQTVSMEVYASVMRLKESASAADVPAEGGTEPDGDTDWTVEDWDYPYEYDDEGLDDGESWPDRLLEFTFSAAGLPAALPADASFTVSTQMLGALFPNFGVTLRGETKKDGSFSLTFCKPFSEGSEPVTILGCSGTLLPGEARDVPDYQQLSWEGTHNVFSFNEQRLSAFTSKVLPLLVRGVFSFVEAAPAAACQSFLDDLTDMGILDMLLD